MQRICRAPLDVNSYLENPKCLLTPDSRRCPFCSEPHPLRIHGWYSRQCLLEGRKGAVVIPVLRLLCPHAGRTVSLLPDFCLPRRQHGPGILGVFLASFIRGLSLLQALRTARPDAPGYSTCQALRDGFLRRKPKILAYLATFVPHLPPCPSSIPGNRREIARLVLPLLDLVIGEPASAFRFHARRIHERFQLSLA